MGDADEAVGRPDPAKWIVAVATRQDPAAFAALFGFYAPRIKSMLMRQGAAADAAEEVTQETLVSVWRKSAFFDPSRSSASAWIFTIARNLRIDRLRGDNRAKLYTALETIESEEPERPDGALETAERQERVRAALGHLPEEQVQVLKLSFFEDRAHGDIATQLNLPLGTVKSRLRLAMNRLRGLLGDLT